MTRMRMVKTTTLGKRRRNPNGIDMDEFPFNLMRLRKNDNRESVLGFSFFQSSAVSGEETEGRRLYSRCTNPIVTNSYPGRRRAIRAAIELLCRQHATGIECRFQLQGVIVALVIDDRS
jgi:hypothetical protein